MLHESKAVVATGLATRKHADVATGTEPIEPPATIVRCMPRFFVEILLRVTSQPFVANVSYVELLRSKKAIGTVCMPAFDRTR